MKKAMYKMNDEQIKELIQLLRKAQDLSLNLFIGTAYISKAYIVKQNELNAKIDALLKDYHV